MQVLLKPKIEYVTWPSTDSKIIYGKNAEVSSCSITQKKCEPYLLKSMFFPQDKTFTPVGDNRVTDIVPFDPDWPTSFDELVSKWAHINGDPNNESTESEESETPSQEIRTITDSNLLEDALHTCKVFTEEWYVYANQKTERRNKLNYIQEENIDKFLNKTVPLIAFDAYEMIELLITVEGMSPKAFGNYKEIKKQIDEEIDNEMRAKHVRKLVMILESKIPASIKFKRPKNIYPVINAKASGSRDMEELKQTRG